MASIERSPKAGKDQNGNVTFIVRWRDKAGKSHKKSFRNDLKSAKAFRADVEQKLASNAPSTYGVNRTTLSDFVDLWINTAIKTETISTRKGLKVSLGWLGDYKISEITAADIYAWRKELEAGRSWIPAPKPGEKDYKRLSRSTAGNVTGQLMQVLRLAKEQGLIDSVPTVRLTKTAIGRDIRSEDLLKVGEIRTMAKNARTQKGHYKARPWLSEMILVASGTGLRIGEICGLQAGDVLQGELKVRRQMGRNGETESPKTDSSIRNVPLAPWVQKILDRLSDGKGVEEFLWMRPTGMPHDRNNTTHALRSMISSYKMRPVTFHDFRHFFASALIAQGLPVTAVQKALGHAKASTTLDTYAHLWPGSDDLIREAVARLKI